MPARNLQCQGQAFLLPVFCEDNRICIWLEDVWSERWHPCVAKVSEVCVETIVVVDTFGPARRRTYGLCVTVRCSDWYLCTCKIEKECANYVSLKKRSASDPTTITTQTHTPLSLCGPNLGPPNTKSWPTNSHNVFSRSMGDQSSVAMVAGCRRGARHNGPTQSRRVFVPAVL